MVELGIQIMSQICIMLYLHLRFVVFYCCHGDVFQRFCMAMIDRWLSLALTTVSLTLFVACVKTKFTDCWWSIMRQEMRCTF